ncbi:MAG: flavin reductase family protein [Muribaculaceae bacterium]|nr:flavin reductase family protein [Muribaculaceae bacterium]
MTKISWKPGTMIYPLPAALVTVGRTPEEWNPITVAWLGTICTNPAMCYISVRPERHSYPILKRCMEFTINLTTASMARATDWCGVRSGKDYDKWMESGLTPIPGEMVASPTIEQSPLSIECRVKSMMSLGSHDMFIADVLNVRADARYIDPGTGAFSLEEAGLMAYCHGKYFSLGEMLGKFGFSVKKK